MAINDDHVSGRVYVRVCVCEFVSEKKIVLGVLSPLRETWFRCAQSACFFQSHAQRARPHQYTRVIHTQHKNHRRRISAPNESVALLSGSVCISVRKEKRKKRYHKTVFFFCSNKIQRKIKQPNTFDTHTHTYRNEVEHFLFYFVFIIIFCFTFCFSLIC